MDEVTKSKVRILGSDYFEALLEEISEEQIPVELGGKMQTRWAWPFSDHSGCSPAQVERYHASLAHALVPEKEQSK